MINVKFMELGGWMVNAATIMEIRQTQTPDVCAIKFMDGEIVTVAMSYSKVMAVLERQGLLEYIME